jgi:hypothetical protein
MKRNVVAAIAVLVALTSFPGCGMERPRILGVDHVSSSNQLSISLASCKGEHYVHQVRVNETSTEVHILVTKIEVSRRAGSSCSDGVIVKLATPLGQRRVIDDSTGGVLTVRPVLRPPAP